MQHEMQERNTHMRNVRIKAILQAVQVSLLSMCWASQARSNQHEPQMLCVVAGIALRFIPAYGSSSLAGETK
ncbi:MAG: hypothetical protein FWC35_01915 [Proteobacteria bacterium]|nr:hypothetical protein [Pseudomonadota bacterium]